jgi:nitroreductase
MTSMDILDAIKKRRSTRNFRPESIPDDLIKKIIEAATWAPTACNIQGWRFIVVNDPAKKEEIVNHGGAINIKDAPLGILVVYDNQTQNTAYYDYIQSGAACIENLLLAANSFGLGGCWMCNLPSHKILRKIFNIPKSFSPIAYVILGYPAGGVGEVARKYSLDALIGYNLFNPRSPQEKINVTGLFLNRILRKIYCILPLFLKKGFLNKFIDKKFVKKFKN